MLCWPVITLYYMLMILLKNKYRQSFGFRMGFKLPQQLPSAPRRIWVHALSVGETLSVIPLIKTLKKKCFNIEIIFSTATETGYGIARERLGRELRHFYYLPHDLPWVMDVFVRRLSPTCFVLVETDVWPNLLGVLGRSEVPRILVNARLSARSAGRHNALRSFLTPFDLFDHIFAQSIEDGEQFVKLGAKPEKVHTTGNLKFDSLPEPLSQEEICRLKGAAGVSENRPVWIAGSTHDGEEEILFRAHRELRKELRDLLLIIAPRQVARATAIVGMAEQYGMPAVARTTGGVDNKTAVYVLDTLGELGSFYALADVAFIGGSLVPFGGHNPLEAIAQGKPCVWGPNLFNFREIESKLLELNLGAKVMSEHQLLSALGAWLKNTEGRQQMESKAGEFLQSNAGCAQRIADFILKMQACSGTHP
jgi:3-deoxy-D-manno-octulosonic-acid transferase